MSLPMRRALPIGGALAALAITFLLAWPLLRTAPQAPEVAPFAKANPIAAAPGWVDAEGGIQRLGVRVEGTVDAVPVHDGDQVKAGALLLRLDDQQSVLERDSAQLDAERLRQQQAALAGQLQRARQDLTRLRPLVREQAEPADELRAAEARVRDLQSQQQLAAIDLRAAELHIRTLNSRHARQELHAPADGEILRVLAHAGDAVAPGTPLLWFVSAGPRIVRAELDERLFGQVHAGMSAEISPEYDDTRTYAARVLRVAAAVGPVQALPELRATAKDDRVVECVLSVEANDLLIGQRVLVSVTGNH